MLLETSVSLLDRLRDPGDAHSWRRLVELYTPLLHRWLRRAGLQETDVSDLVQEVLTVLVRELPQFRYDPERGAFRAWLRTITTNRLRAFLRSRRTGPRAAGEFDSLLDQLQDPHSELSRQWDREHDEHVVGRLLDLIQPDFEESTWAAFRRVALDGVKPARAAAELELTVNAVFIAKSRVMRRLRQEMAGLSDA